MQAIEEIDNEITILQNKIDQLKIDKKHLLTDQHTYLDRIDTHGYQNDFDKWTINDIKRWDYSRAHLNNMLNVLNKMKKIKINIPTSAKKWQIHIPTDLFGPYIIKQKSTGQKYTGSIKNGKFHGLGILCVGISDDIRDDSGGIFINGVFVKGTRLVGDITTPYFKEYNMYLPEYE